MKIVLIDFFDVINTAGGMEKVLCNMANELMKRGHEITVICSDKNYGLPFFKLDKNINFINLNGTGKNFKISKFLKIKKEVIRILGKLNKSEEDKFRILDLFGKIIPNINNILYLFKPNIIVTFDKNSLMLIQQLINIKIPVVAMIHDDANNILNNNSSKFLIDSYDKCDYIQVLIKNNIATVNDYCTHSNVIWIPNCIDIYKAKDFNQTFYKIITIGRLNRDAKRQHLLIQSFNKIHNEIPPEWSVEIVGGTNRLYEDEYKNYMCDYIKNTCLNEKIFFSGVSKNIHKKLQNADIFAFPSACEGMPLALMEAMAAGLPAIGYKSCPSVNELIIDGYNGFLCEEGIDDFAEKLKILMFDVELRIKMGQNARKSMMQYAPEKIWNQWEALINEVVNNHKEN